MLISQRRLTWGSISVLVLLAAFLNQPLRSWLDRACVALVLDTNLTVNRLHFHTHSSVLEAEEVRWENRMDQRLSGFHSSRVWIALEAQELVDRRIIVPHVEFDQPVIFLDESSIVEQPAVRFWQHDLAAFLASLSWKDLQEHCGSLLSAKQIHQTWNDRMDRWHYRASDILTQVHAIQGPAGSNPLRNADELQTRLKKLDALAAEQQVLIQQFDGIKKLLLSECGRLENEFEREMSESSPMVAIGNLQAEACNPQSIGESILEQAADNGWQSMADYGEIADSLTHLFPHQPPPAFDFDVWDPASDPRLLELKNIRARGIFEHRSENSSFSLDAAFAVRHDAKRGTLHEANWEYQFHTDRTLIAVSVQQTRKDQAFICLQVYPLSSIEEAEKADASSTQAEIADSQDLTNIQPLCALQVRTNQHGLAGEMQLRSLADFASPSELEEANWVLQASQSAEKTRIEIAGTWTNPRFTWSKDDVNHLASQIDTVLRQHEQHRSRAERTDVRQQFDAELGQLKQLIDLAANESRSILESHGPQIVAARNTLQSNLDPDDETVFARRPNQATTR